MAQRVRDRCNEGELVGLYHVLHRVSLKQNSFRIVEYIQDLVQATPNGSQLLSDWQESVQIIQELQNQLQTVPKWRVFEIARINAENRQTRESIQELQQGLLMQPKSG